MSDVSTGRLGYQPSLDGFRGVAVALVVAGHAGVPFISYGGVAGVEMFFVLSGFLITRLMIEESAVFGNVSLSQFYLRRAYRLIPALVVLLTVVTWWNGLTASIWAAGYAANVARYLHVDLGMLNHTWTLAVEEQFYLIWPVAFLVAGKSVRRMTAAAAIVLLAWRFTGEPNAYYGISRFAGIAIGCFAATVRWRPTPPIQAAGWILLVFAALDRQASQTALFVTAADIGAVVVMLALVGQNTLAWRPLVRVGRLSYGWYLWHTPALAVFSPLVAVPLSWVAAELSYRLVEQPWLARKPRREPPVPRRAGRPTALHNVNRVQ